MDASVHVGHPGTHENAHVPRRDPLVQWVSLLSRALFWFHPLAWWLERQLSHLAEEACDVVVLQEGHDAGGYSQCLVELARAVQQAGWRLNVAGMAMPGSYLPHRVRKILGGVNTSRVPVPRMAGAVTACVVCSVMFGAGVLEPQDANGNSRNRFDVASVKPASAPSGVNVLPDGGMITRKGSGVPLPRNTGGPGTGDPGRIHYSLITMKALLKRAYGSYYEIKGPGWIDTETYAIEATMPPATTKEQFEGMLRNLILDRFQLKFHEETREINGYSLIVGKNGPKLKESVAAGTPAESVDPEKKPEIGPDGFWVRPPRPGPDFSVEGRRAGLRIWAVQQTLDSFVKLLTGPMGLGVPVTDATGLKSKYDYTLTFAGRLGPGGLTPPPEQAAAEDAGGLPDIFGALQAQLGLKLERTRIDVREMVVDRVEKAPVAN